MLGLPESIYERPVEQAAEQPEPKRCIDTLLGTFETAWMGQPKPAKSALSSLLQETSASVANASHTLSCSDSASPQSLGRSNNASGPPSGSYRGTSTGMAMASKRPHEEEDDAAELTMLPMTPFPSHMLLHGKVPNGGAVSAAAAPSAVVPVLMPASALGMKAAPGQQHPGEFAPVFFSPIPLSYLNLAHSESESSFLDAAGSPDVTLRGGRLAKTGSGDWGDAAASGGGGIVCSPGASGSPLSTSLQQRSRLADSAVQSFPLSSINEHGLAAASNGQQKGQQQQQTQLGGLSGSGTQRGGATAGRGATTASRASSASPTSFLHPLLSRPPVQPAAQPVAMAVPAGAVQITPFGMVQQIDSSNGGGGMLAAGAGSISIAAAASAKRNSQWGTLRLVAGMAMIPHVDKVRGTTGRYQRESTMLLFQSFLCSPLIPPCPVFSG